MGVVCLLKNMASKTISPQFSPSELEDEDDVRSVPENVRKQTQVLFYEYVDSRCSHDRDLSKEQASLLHESASTCIRKTDVGGQVKQMEINDYICTCNYQLRIGFGYCIGRGSLQRC